MRRLRLCGFAGVLVTAFVLTQAPLGVAAAASSMTTQEWLDTIRVPLRADSSDRDNNSQTASTGAGTIAFQPGKAQLSADGRRSLDALATALMLADLSESSFRIQWLANPAETGGLAERRAGVIEAELRSHQALPPARLTIQPASAGFAGYPASAPSNALLLQVRIAGRWWGGE